MRFNYEAYQKIHDAEVAALKAQQTIPNDSAIESISDAQNKTAEPAEPTEQTEPTEPAASDE